MRETPVLGALPEPASGAVSGRREAVRTTAQGPGRCRRQQRT